MYWNEELTGAADDGGTLGGATEGGGWCGADRMAAWWWSGITHEADGAGWPANGGMAMDEAGGNMGMAPRPS